MREKGQTEVAKTLETPVFSRGIEILTEKFKFQKSGALHPEYGLFVTEQRAIAARQCMKRAPNSRATADRVILLLEPLC